MIGTGCDTAKASGGIWQQSRNNPILPTLRARRRPGPRPVRIGRRRRAADLQGRRQHVRRLPGRHAVADVAVLVLATCRRPTGANPELPGPDAGVHPGSGERLQGALRRLDTRAAGPTGTAVSPSSRPRPTPDVVVVITDGNPTNYGDPPQGPGGTFNRFREVENGIFSANAVKAQGTRVLASASARVRPAPQPALNLRAISGPTGTTAPTRTPPTTTRPPTTPRPGAALRNLALGNCRARSRWSSRSCRRPPRRASITGAHPGRWLDLHRVRPGDGVTIDRADQPDHRDRHRRGQLPADLPRRHHQRRR